MKPDHDCYVLLQISLTMSSGRPVKLVPIQDPGTPTVSNAMSASSRTLIRCLQLELRVCPPYVTVVYCPAIAGVPAVLKFLKFQKCPEIVLKFEIVLKYYLFVNNVLKVAVDVQ